MFKHIKLRNRLNALNFARTKRKLKQEKIYRSAFGENNDIAVILFVLLILFGGYCIVSDPVKFDSPSVHHVRVK